MDEGRSSAKNPNTQLVHRIGAFKADGSIVEVEYVAGNTKHELIGNIRDVTPEYLEFEQLGTSRVCLLQWPFIVNVALLPEATGRTASMGR